MWGTSQSARAHQVIALESSFHFWKHGLRIEEGTRTISIDAMVSPSTLRSIWQAHASSEPCKNALTKYFSLLNDAYREQCRGYSPNFHASEVHVSSFVMNDPLLFLLPYAHFIFLSGSSNNWKWKEDPFPVWQSSLFFRFFTI